MKKIIITAGGTSEKIDNVRKITNSSSGKLGMTIANHLLEGKDIGTIGIIGPTRMDYSKVISVMKYISKKINDDFKNGKF